MKETKLGGYLVLVLVTLIWGTTFTVTKSSLVEVGPLYFLAWRFTFASLGLLLLNARNITGGIRITGDEWAGGLLIGLFMAVGFVFQTVGMVYTSAAKAGFITGLAVVLVPVVGAIFFRRRPSRWVYIATVVAALGLGLLTLDFDGALGINIGDVWVLGCALSYAFYILYLGIYAKKVRVLVLSLVQVVFTGVVCWILALWLEQPVVVPGSVWLGLVYLALFATVFTTVGQAWGQRILSPERAALIFTLEPVFAALVAYLVLAERLPAQSLLGSSLIMVGILMAELAPGRVKTASAE